MRTFVAAVAAAGLLVGAAFLANVASSGEAAAQESTPDETLQSPSGFLQEVLDDLVAEGVLTESQKEAVVEAVRERAEEFDGKRPFRRGFHHGFRGGFQLRDLLDDGVVDAEELAELPEGHPLTDPEGPAAEYLDDGQITRDELNELREARRAERGTEGTNA
jgi:hypothetical protein